MINIDIYKLIKWANSYPNCLVLNSAKVNGIASLNTYNLVVAVGSKKHIEFNSNNNFNHLKTFLNNCKLNNQFAFGYFTYDLKNQLEDLQSKNIDNINFPEYYFFVPEHLIFLTQNGIEIISDTKNLLQEIENYIEPELTNLAQTNLQPKVSKQDYITTVNKIKQNIIDGDVYELNYCIEFFNKNAKINPENVYLNLQNNSPTPFGAFFRLNQKYLLCASPERFVKKVGEKIYSQPIKGTIKRGSNSIEDEQLKQELLNSEKERAENLMIVDLVRNDLAKSCQTGSIKVDELFGIYSFKQVHQMISTVSGTVKPEIDNLEIIKNAFPMGSMTGAPKIMAMQLIDHYENTKRGLYSGSVGYFNPNGDFDFNVVIRSLQYNADNNYLNCMVGSAITFDSIAEKEYEECLIKAKAMMEALKTNQ